MTAGACRRSYEQVALQYAGYSFPLRDRCLNQQQHYRLPSLGPGSDRSVQNELGNFVFRKRTNRCRKGVL